MHLNSAKLGSTWNNLVMVPISDARNQPGKYDEDILSVDFIPKTYTKFSIVLIVIYHTICVYIVYAIIKKV